MLMLRAFISGVVLGVVAQLIFCAFVGDREGAAEMKSNFKVYSFLIVPILGFGVFIFLYIGIEEGLTGLIVFNLIILAVAAVAFFICLSKLDEEVAEKRPNPKRQEELLDMALSANKEDKHRFDELYGRPLCRTNTQHGSNVRWAHQAVMRIAENEGWEYVEPTGLGYDDKPNEYREREYTKWYQECKFPKWAMVHYPEEFKDPWSYGRYVYLGPDPQYDLYKSLSPKKAQELQDLRTDVWRDQYDLWLADGIDVCDPEVVSKFPNARAMQDARVKNRAILRRRYPSYDECRWYGTVYPDRPFNMQAKIIRTIRQIENRAHGRLEQDPSLTIKQAFESLIIDEIYTVFVLDRREHTLSSFFGRSDYSCDDEELTSYLTKNINLYGECYAASCEGGSMWDLLDELATSKEARELACKHLKFPLPDDDILWSLWSWYKEAGHTPAKGLAKQIHRLREKAKAQEEEWQRAREED